MSLPLQNLSIYCLQVTILVALGGLLPLVCGLQNARARLAWWQALLALCALLPIVQPWKQSFIQSSIAFSTRSAVPLPAAAEPVPVAFPWETAVLAVIAAGCALRLIWLALGFYRLRTYLDRAALYQCPLARRMEVHSYVGISADVTSPVTFGVRRPVILFPTRFVDMEPAMQETIACHELLHVARRDWLFTIAEELVRAVFWFHPAIWWLLGEIQLTREQVVDAEVVRLTQSRQEYLNALLAIASTRARLDLAPAPLFLRKRHLSQRVAKILKEVRMSHTRIAASLAGISSILLLAAWLMVRALPLEAAPQVKDAPGVSVEQAEASLLHRAPVGYPKEAREKGIQGTVTLEVEIDEAGGVADARVLSGPQELRRAALQSVLQWHYAKNMPLPARAQVVVRFELPPPDATPARPQAEIARAPVPAPAAAVSILKIIDVSALPDELRAQLQQKLAGYEGRPYSNQLMREVEREATAVDKHLMFRWSAHPGMENGQRAFSLQISLAAGGSPWNVGGGVIGGVAGGVSGGTPEGVIGGVVGAVPSAVPPAPSASGSTPQRIRVGGNVQQSMLVQQTRPMYPPLAKQARIQGVVRLNAIIAADGTVAGLTLISGHPLLAPAALEAVKQWVYKPTLLNGEPVEVVTQIDVNFTLSE